MTLLKCKYSLIHKLKKTQSSRAGIILRISQDSIFLLVFKTRKEFYYNSNLEHFPSGLWLEVGVESRMNALVIHANFIKKLEFLILYFSSSWKVYFIWK